MSELILKDIRSRADEAYMGYRLIGGRVVPVHIYSGASRVICGYVSDVTNIQKLSYVYDAKGQTSKGRDTLSILNWLKEENRISDTISESSLHTLRLFLQQILNADGAVFSGTDTNMVSYTSGSDSFISGKSMYEDAGELIGTLLSISCPDLTGYIIKTLKDNKDSISLLFAPILDNSSVESRPYTMKADLPLCFDPDKIESFPNAKAFLDSLKESGTCLLEHLKLQENKLNVLRQFNLFCMFHLFRFMANVEHIYCGTPEKLFLLDFSEGGTTGQSRMSSLSFMQIHRSMSRFYKWTYAQILKKEGWDKESLLKEGTPQIDRGRANKNNDELDIIWSLAKKKCASMPENDAIKEIASTVFNMLERDAKFSPATYMKLFGIHAGILVQGTRSLPSRFKPKVDMLEVIIRSCVLPGETLRGSKLKDNLYRRMSVIIGGDENDVERLNSAECPITSDDDSLILNYEKFAEKLRSMNFAETMADGILQINLGGDKL